MRDLYEEIKTSVVHRDLDETHFLLWKEACHRFHTSYDSLAFPGGLDRERQLLRARDPQAVEMAVRFLESDPWFFRSGYIKEELLEHLRRAVLTDDQQERLRTVILDRIEGAGRREFRRYCLLARLLDAPIFREAVQKRSESPNPRISRQACWVLTALNHGAKP